MDGELLRQEAANTAALAALERYPEGKELRSAVLACMVHDRPEKPPVRFYRRNLFRLARTIKGMETLQTPDDPAVLDAVKAWAILSSKALKADCGVEDARAEFATGWELAKTTGPGKLVRLLSIADEGDRELPLAASRYGPDLPRRLLRLIRLMDEEHVIDREDKERAGDFKDTGGLFLARQVAGQLFNVSHTTIGYWLKRFEADGLIFLVKRGHTGRAAVYRWIGDPLPILDDKEDVDINESDLPF